MNDENFKHRRLSTLSSWADLQGPERLQIVQRLHALIHTLEGNGLNEEHRKEQARWLCKLFSDRHTGDDLVEDFEQDPEGLDEDAQAALLDSINESFSSPMDTSYLRVFSYADSSFEDHEHLAWVFSLREQHFHFCATRTP